VAEAEEQGLAEESRLFSCTISHTTTHPLVSYTEAESGPRSGPPCPGSGARSPAVTMTSGAPWPSAVTRGRNSTSALL
jgi:hypothetical protein